MKNSFSGAIFTLEKYERIYMMIKPIIYKTGELYLCNYFCLWVLVGRWSSEDVLTQSNRFLPILSHPIRSLGRILTTSSLIMGIVLKEEHMLADVSAMMSSELRRHCNHFFIIIF